MKKWIAPSVDELSIIATAQGKNISTNFDEIRVNQNGNYWVIFSSGEDSNPEVGGTLTVNS